MEGLSGEHASQGLTAELVGLLILNELKCFRKELTNEVKNLARKLDLVTGENFCQRPKASSVRKIDNLMPSWRPNNVFQGVGQNAASSDSSSFKEISPDTDNGILNNHIAFRMSKPYHLQNSSNETPVEDLKITATYCESNDDYNAPNTYQEPYEKDFIVEETYQEGKEESINNVTKNSFHDTPAWASASEKKSLDLSQTSMQESTARHAATNRNKIKSKCSVIYKCTICEEQFDSQELYTEHYSRQHSSNESSTALSLKSFWQDQSIKNVFDQPQPKLIYCCSVCSRQFSSKGSLLRHSVLHSGVKKFVCKLCGKRFFRSDHLKSHLPTHSRQKQYQCPVCQKYFSRSVNFENHMKMHENMSEVQNDQQNTAYFNAPVESDEAYNLTAFSEEDLCAKEESADTT